VKAPRRVIGRLGARHRNPDYAHTVLINMSREKLRIHNTPLQNIVSNLRGEIGEITFSWLLMRRLLGQAARRRATEDVDELADSELATLHALADRLESDVVARLSELAEPKVGRLTFHFASKKLGEKFYPHVSEYARFVRKNRFVEKRNLEISHKELPEKRLEHAPIHIPYPTIVRALALAMRLMKKIDKIAVGHEARFFWPKLRRRRYEPSLSPHVEYVIAPYMKLTPAERGAVLDEEAREGKAVWEPMRTKINGEERIVIVNKKWAGILVAPNQVMFLDVYPLNNLESITFDPPEPENAPADPGGA
jgi:hypothetical protein